MHGRDNKCGVIYRPHPSQHAVLQLSEALQGGGGAAACVRVWGAGQRPFQKEGQKASAERVEGLPINPSGT